AVGRREGSCSRAGEERGDQKASPADITAKLQAEVAKALAQGDVKERLGALGFEAIGSTPQAVARFIDHEAAKYQQIIKDAGIKGEGDLRRAGRRAVSDFPHASVGPPSDGHVSARPRDRALRLSSRSQHPIACAPQSTDASSCRTPTAGWLAGPPAYLAASWP